MIKKIFYILVLLQINLLAQVSNFTTIIDGNGIDIPVKIITTHDGGFVVGGYTNSYGNGDYDFYLVKLDESGNLVWSKTYGGESEEILYDLKLCKDNSIILSGSTKSFGAVYNDIYLVKTNLLGDTLWTNQLKTSDDNIGYSISETDSGYIVGSQTPGIIKPGIPYLRTDFWLLYLNGSGDTLWTKIYSLEEDFPYDEQIQFVTQIEDSGFFLAGNVYVGGYVIGLIKTDNFGNIITKKLWGGGAFEDYFIRSGLYVPDVGCYFVGYYINRHVMHPYMSFCVYKFDLNGNYARIKSCFNNISPDLLKGGHDIIKTSTDDILVTGYGRDDTSYGLGVIKLSQNLDIKWQRIYSDYQIGYSITESSDNGYVVAGTVEDDIIIFKTDSLGTITNINEKYYSRPNFKLLQNYPNPFNPNTTIPYRLFSETHVKIELYNILGERINTLLSGNQTTGNYTIDLDARELPSGVYFYRLETDEFVETKKCLLLR